MGSSAKANDRLARAAGQGRATGMAITLSSSLADNDSDTGDREATCNGEPWQGTVRYRCRQTS
ncbi:hypothetical protein CO2235_MP130208 [Cupriavidus oxalaticus]|uniref:Uncharacterized protein n=1 Tax=Cupriavidus oxalaticus TaxID=96344 RepID=A0A375GJL6_9BURK|nr:hypothetical protein CO2235_U1020006 [Cupriavidus oxalaticus]SPC19473.1 hypothetical protein CO2235_MP130208 [Cupriavidus oxalaticus]